MLVLTRRPGESIVIAGDIKLTVVSVGPGRVKIGIEAPSHVRIDRQEIHDKIEQAADVLAAVGSEIGSGGQNTMINTGADTAMIVVDGPDAKADAPQVPAPASVANTGANVPPLGKLGKFRKPRV